MGCVLSTPGSRTLHKNARCSHTQCRCEQQMLFMWELQWAEDTGGRVAAGRSGNEGGIGPLHDLPESTGPSGGEVCRA